MGTAYIKFNSGKSRTIKNVGYWTNKTHVMFWKVGVNRKRTKPVAKYKLSTIRTWSCK